MATDIHSSRGSKSGYWLFQFNGSDSIDYHPGDSQRWAAHKEMRAGDGVALWKPGKGMGVAGIFGLGTILTDPEDKPFYGNNPLSVEWQCTYTSESLLLREKLRNDPRLNQLRVLKRLWGGFERVSESQWRRISQLLKSSKRAPGVPHESVKHICEKISVEQMLKERTQSDRPATTRTILMRERKLLYSYIAHMKARGIQFESRRMHAASETNFIRCDLYEPKRGVLFEAKGLLTREAIRMAIGELLDYKRFIRPTPSLAVLLPERPKIDLVKLLTGQKINLVWQTKNGFEDNSKGQLS